MLKSSSAPSSQLSVCSRRNVQPFSGIRRSLKRSKLKDFVDKSYALIRSEKYEQFLQKLGATEEIYKSAAKARPTLTLKKEKEGYALVTSYPDFPKQIVKFKNGEIITRKLHDGTIIKSLFEIKESTIKEVQDWNNKEVIILRNYVNNELIVSMEVDEVKCFRHYKNALSKHSIQTETSRRMQTDVESEVCVSPPVESFIEKVSDSKEEINNVCF